MTALVRSVTVLLLLMVPAPAIGQKPPPVLDRLFPPEPATSEEALGPYGERDLARARFAASQADIVQLKQGKRDAVRFSCDGRRREFFAGRGTLEFLDEMDQQALESELVLSLTERGQLAILERYWKRRIEIEEVNRCRDEAGRIDLKEYLATRYFRMQVENRLADARARNKDLSPWSTADPPHDGEEEIVLPKLLARRKLEASSVDVRSHQLTQWGDAKYIHERRLSNCFLGRGTLDFALRWSVRWLDVERALAQNDEEMIAALERHWISTRLSEDLYRHSFEAGRSALQDREQARENRLEAEAWLVEARSRTRLTNTHILKSIDTDEYNPEAFGYLPRLMRAAAEVGRKNPKSLQQERLIALRAAYQAREKEFFGGRGTLDFLLEAAGRLIEQERQLADSDAEDRAALERHWKRVHMIETITQARYDAGRVTAEDVQQSRYHRLEAELWLLKPRPKRQP